MPFTIATIFTVLGLLLLSSPTGAVVMEDATVSPYPTTSSTKSPSPTMTWMLSPSKSPSPTMESTPATPSPTTASSTTKSPSPITKSTPVPTTTAIQAEMLLPATTSDDSEMSFPTITDDAIETPLPNSPEDVTGMFEPTIMTTLEYDLLDIFVTCDGIPKWKPSSTAPYYAADALELAYNDVYKLSSPFDLTDMDFVGQLSQPISWVGGSASTMEFQGRRQVLAESEHLYGEMPEAYHEIGSAFTDNLLAMKDPAFSKVKNCRIESISIA